MLCTSIRIVGHGDGLGSAIQSSVTPAGRRGELGVSVRGFDVRAARG